MSDNLKLDKPIAIRPKFEMTSKSPYTEIGQAFDMILKQDSPPCKGYVHDQYVTLHPLPGDLHYWSPQLSIYMEEEEGATILHGRYGPRPAVWTMFVFFYSIIGTAAVIIAVIGFANMSLDESGSILWLLPLLIIVFLSLYLVAYLGQKKGHDQMVELQEIAVKVVGKA